ncbi:hypothetical protein B0I22_3146 [Epilithonimonas xixisoli]|uniref:Uncharacterized protein n=1 Tax=Epilithonimonas xixisoli TaxID=1476462 RepID=A0A4R8I446_9FLAO|nr:hypothetical protein B0I22_3146 [Epilithonimonas xixisoli]
MRQTQLFQVTKKLRQSRVLILFSNRKPIAKSNPPSANYILFTTLIPNIVKAFLIVFPTKSET